MATPKLSDAFLAAHKHRLDAIGPWTVEGDRHNLDIRWKRPPALAGHWVPFNLVFHTDDGGPSLDPDDRMFELWDLFHSRQIEFVSQLRRLADDLVEGIGTVRKVCVNVYREGDDEGPNYSLGVFILTDDDEHLYQADYDEDADGFVSVYS